MRKTPKTGVPVKFFLLTVPVRQVVGDLGKLLKNQPVHIYEFPSEGTNLPGWANTCFVLQGGMHV